jgi:MoaA/NifB/PqqE/SkfB family radical SAM enzyme
MAYQALKKSLIKKAIKTRVPLIGEFEITAACNLNCKMCYAKKTSPNDLSVEAWKHIFKDAVDAGLVYALLTGGEPFLRSDFITLYTYLYDLGTRITIFSNGTVFNDSLLETFKQRPPELIVFSIYGVNEATSHSITQTPMVTRKLNHTIDLLKAHSINVSLRVLPLKPLFNELDHIIEYAKVKDVPLSFTDYIFPVETPSFNVLTWRLDPKELSVFKTKLTRGKKNNQNKTSKQASCAALRAAYFINHLGEMQPCALAYTPRLSVLSTSFLDVFNTLSKQFESLKTSALCQACDLKEDCLECYARRLIENKPASLNQCARYLKQLAKHQSEMRRSDETT